MLRAQHRAPIRKRTNARVFGLFIAHNCTRHGRRAHCRWQGYWERQFTPLPKAEPLIRHRDQHRTLRTIPADEKLVVGGPGNVVAQHRIPPDMFQQFLREQTLTVVSATLAGTDEKLVVFVHLNSSWDRVGGLHPNTAESLRRLRATLDEGMTEYPPDSKNIFRGRTSDIERPSVPHEEFRQLICNRRLTVVY